MKFLFDLTNIGKNSAVLKAYDRLVGVFAIIAELNVLSNSYSTKDELSNFDYIVCANIWQVLRTWLYTLGSKTKIIFWVQGTVAEESYLKNNSKLRFYILKLIESICLYLSDAFIFVSPYMQEFYSSKFFVRNKPNLIIPCISDLNYKKTKKTPYSFCYLGGMSQWQNFPIVIQIMTKINEKYPQSRFKIATNEISIANQVISKFSSTALKDKIELSSLSSKNEVENFLSNCEYGFLIRDDILVNQVASPIKLAEYLSCGVNVITTNAIRSYSPLLGEAGVIIETIKDVDNIQFNANEKAALQLYNELFSQSAVQPQVKIFINQLRGLISG